MRILSIALIYSLLFCSIHADMNIQKKQTAHAARSKKVDLLIEKISFTQSQLAGRWQVEASGLGGVTGSPSGTVASGDSVTILLSAFVGNKGRGTIDFVSFSSYDGATLSHDNPRGGPMTIKLVNRKTGQVKISINYTPTGFSGPITHNLDGFILPGPAPLHFPERIVATISSVSGVSPITAIEEWTLYRNQK